MKIIICIDDTFGLAFNKRRQSRDSAVVADILSLATGSHLLMTAYSAKLFGDAAVTVVDDPMTAAESDDFCFLEVKDPTPYAEFIDSLIVYRWHRKYPHDLSLGLDLGEYRLVSRLELTGTSHEKITREIYEK